MLPNLLITFEENQNQSQLKMAHRWIPNTVNISWPDIEITETQTADKTRSYLLPAGGEVYELRLQLWHAVFALLYQLLSRVSHLGHVGGPL